jgi:RNA polymerase sigma factor (sigma-70 family)
MVMRDPVRNSSPTDGVELGDAWPSFLDHLDRAPDRAFQGFYRFIHRLMAVCPPRVYLSIHPSQRDDLLHDIILHCCRDDFRVLRRYADRGKPFSAWLQLVARNKVLDFLRAERQAAAVPLETDDDERPDIVVVDDGPAADQQLDRQRILGLVREGMQRLTSDCRLLIQAAAEGYKPREITRLMGWPADWNKKASDDLRACRQRLRGVLGALGLDPDELAGQFSP